MSTTTQSEQIKATLAADLKTWVEGADGSDFPIQNLPFGVFVRPHSVDARVGVAIGSKTLDLVALFESGLLNVGGLEKGDLHSSSLNALIARGTAVRQAIRLRLSELLRHDNAELRDNTSVVDRAFVDRSQTRMLLPVHVGDFVDFYSSLEHATNVGSMFRDPSNPLLPNWKHIPIGYHGRSSSLLVSGQEFFRPTGQLKAENEPPMFGPSRQLDFELEMGFIVGRDTAPGEHINATRAAEHMFGMVLVNDWSARDIQKWEYVPLGPFLGKSFATTVSPWVVTMEVIDALRCTEPDRDVPILPYLEDGGDKAVNIDLKVELQSQKMDAPQTIAQTNFRRMYWTINQQLAHMSSNGTPVRVGDLYASGTVSGDKPDSYGSMLELCWRGTKPLKLNDGNERKFLEDYDRVIMSGTATLPGGVSVGFGNCEAQILPSRGL